MKDAGTWEQSGVPDDSVLSKLMGLDTGASLIDMHEQTMRHSAEEMGR